ncbi:MAG: YdjY domain-containing protein [Pirellulales bacterium]
MLLPVVLGCGVGRIPQLAADDAVVAPNSSADASSDTALPEENTLPQDEPPNVEAIAEQLATDAAKSGEQRRRLDPRYDVWVDMNRHHVILLGEVCLREGGLEMLACLRGTKEHESILSVNTEAYLVHAALLAVGAEAGNPVEFRPEYKAATGSEVDVALYWTDAEGNRQRQWAREWIRGFGTGETLAVPWVFGGSGYWVDEVVDPATGEQKVRRHYKAEEGDLICVSNFPSAMLDLPIESSQSAEALLFEAFTERIPPLGTKVAMVLIPRPKNPPPDSEADEAASDAVTKDPATQGSD